jgi:GNAT superfamily N-acetyltransferase
MESHDLFITNCGIPETEFNRAFLKRPDAPLDAALERAENYFRGVGLPYAITVRSDCESESCIEALRKAGWERGRETPAMVLAPIRDAARATPDLEIREVATDADLAHFQETAFAGFGFPAQAGRIFITDQFLHHPGATLYLGLVDGEPACTSSLVVTAGIAGIYWVATLEAHRNRGFGEAITWAAVRGGIERGCHMASLQASTAGEPIYARMGFATPVRYVKFERP